jgi:hypothetical protein
VKKRRLVSIVDDDVSLREAIEGLLRSMSLLKCDVLEHPARRDKAAKMKLEKMLVPLDGSPLAAPAIETAIGLALPILAEIVAVAFSGARVVYS